MAETRLGGWGATLLTLGLVTTSAQGEVYKYQDAQGRWQFSDRPQAGAAGSTPVHVETELQPTRDRDLATRLGAAFPAATDLERATLAVVGVETALGHGAGFFVSADGYVLTNRHVVRPTGSTVWKERQEGVEKAQQQVEGLRAKVQELRERLGRLDREMARYRAYLAGPDVEDRLTTDKEYRALKENQGKVRKRIAELEGLERDAAKRLRSDKVRLEADSVASDLARDFPIVLKDQTRLRARLISVSEAQDLALLKLDGYRVPALQADPSGRLSQGQPVYAIGSPLGMADAMTSGVVTRVDADQILTDAQLLPGNSGGPLIDGAGRVRGVNVSKRVQGGESAYTQGFGLAIPIGVALQAFAELQEVVLSSGRPGQVQGLPDAPGAPLGATPTSERRSP
jgi:S1-C subfamily serine protease